MTRDSSTRRWIGVACACVLGTLAVAQCKLGTQPAAPPRAATHVRRARWAAPTPAASIGAVRAADLDRVLITTSAVAAVPGSDPLPAPSRPLPPELERQRQLAVVAWTAQAQRRLTACVARPVEDRRATALTVFLAPDAPRAGEHAPQLRPRWIALPPDDRARLARDLDPAALQGCLAEVTSLAVPVALAGPHVALALPASAEHVLVQL